MKSGKVIRYAGSRRGNRKYAAQTQKRIDASVEELYKISGTLLSITLTSPYKYSVKSIFESWKMIKKRWSVFLQWIHRNGFNAYIMSYEACKKGGCHIHLIINYKNKLNENTSEMIVRYCLNKKNIPRDFVDNEKTIRHIKRRIKKSWKIGSVKIKIIDDENVENAVSYVRKEIGWGSQIEDALRNAKKGEATEGDIKKLWGHYISMKLNYRRWSISHNLKPSLDYLMNNSIKNNKKLMSTDKEDIIEYVIIPSSAIKSGKIELKCGTVEVGSDEINLVNDLFDKKSQNNTDINQTIMETLIVDEVLTP